jgi:integrase
LNEMGYFDYPVNSNSERERFSPTTREGAHVSFLYDRQGHRKYLTAPERRAFLHAARRLPAEARTFCRLLAYTGARISEVLNLTPSQIDLSARVVIFESLKKRHRGVFRAVPVPQKLLRELDQVHSVRVRQAHEFARDRKLWPWCRTTAWYRVKGCMAAARISGPQASPKGLRHAFAVAALQAGIPINLVKRWLGHARLTTTEIYLDVVGAEELSIASRLWKKFEGG